MSSKSGALRSEQQLERDDIRGSYYIECYDEHGAVATSEYVIEPDPYYGEDNLKSFDPQLISALQHHLIDPATDIFERPYPSALQNGTIIAPNAFSSFDDPREYQEVLEDVIARNPVLDELRRLSVQPGIHPDVAKQRVRANKILRTYAAYEVLNGAYEPTAEGSIWNALADKLKDRSIRSVGRGLLRNAS